MRYLLTFTLSLIIILCIWTSLSHSISLSHSQSDCCVSYSRPRDILGCLRDNTLSTSNSDDFFQFHLEIILQSMNISRYQLIDSWDDISRLKSQLESSDLEDSLGMVLHPERFVISIDSHLIENLLKNSSTFFFTEAMIVFSINAVTRTFLKTWSMENPSIPPYDSLKSLLESISFSEENNLCQSSSLHHFSLNSTPLFADSELVVSSVQDNSFNLVVWGEIHSSLRSQLSPLSIDIYRYLLSSNLFVALCPTVLPIQFTHHSTQSVIAILNEKLFIAEKDIDLEMIKLDQDSTKENAPEYEKILSIFKRLSALTQLRDVLMPSRRPSVLTRYEQETDIAFNKQVEILVWCYVSMRDLTVKTYQIAAIPLSYDDMIRLQPLLTQTISLPIHITTLLLSDSSRYRMIHHILQEVLSLFLPRLHSLSMDEEIVAQYHYDLHSHKCHYEMKIASIDVYVECIQQLLLVIRDIEKNELTETIIDKERREKIQKLRKFGNSDPQIEIERRPILVKEVSQVYQLHGGYLCDVGNKELGIKLFSQGIRLIGEELAALHRTTDDTYRQKYLSSTEIKLASMLTEGGICAQEYSEKLFEENLDENEESEKYALISKEYLSRGVGYYSSQLSLLPQEEEKYQLALKSLRSLSQFSSREIKKSEKSQRIDNKERKQQIPHEKDIKEKENVGIDMKRKKLMKRKKK